MNDPILESFLTAQEADALALNRESDLIRVVPVQGTPPFAYILELACKGLCKDRQGNVVEASEWAVAIHFPADYVRQEVHPAQVLQYLGAPAQPHHPNIRPPFICLHLSPGMKLVSIVHAVFDLVTWNLWATGDEGLNHEASQWARSQDPARFPIDRRPLKRRALALSIAGAAGPRASGRERL